MTMPGEAASCSPFTNAAVIIDPPLRSHKSLERVRYDRQSRSARSSVAPVPALAGGACAILPPAHAPAQLRAVPLTHPPCELEDVVPSYLERAPWVPLMQLR